MKKIITFLLLALPFFCFAQTNLNLSALPLQLSFNENTTPTYTFSGAITNIVSRNVGIVSWSIANNTVTFNALKAGRTGLKITSNGQQYYIGIRVKHADGSIPGMPNYLSIGSVSEDLSSDLAFWKDLDTDGTNKAMDIRYIYINGGAIGGWQSWGPQRPATFARESIKHGLIPFFVYYNIPDNGESYQLDLAHAQDPAYMTAYFNDLNAFMDSVQTIMQGDLYGIILEPDFLGYMQQNASPSDPYLIPTAVGANTIAPNAGNIATLVHRINKTVADKRTSGHKIFYGWQLNLWSYGVHAGSKGILRKSDNLNLAPAKYLIQKTAAEIAKYGMNAGILSNNADFISIDKYGLDAMGQNNTADPADCTWFFNNDHWNNYLLYANTIHTTSGKPVVLWQIPVGRINQSIYQSAYTGQTYADVNNTPTKYEDSATDFFLGDNLVPTDVSRINYFMQNKWNDPKLYYGLGSGVLRFESHLQETKDNGVISVLFGAGVNASTDGVGSPPSDDYFWIQKVQDYYRTGTIPLGATYGEAPLNPCASGCSPTIKMITPVANESIVRSELDSVLVQFWVNDADGFITNIVTKIDGQTVATPNLNDLQLLKWTPPTAFGAHTLTVTATDNTGNSTTLTTPFTLVNFDAAACGYPEWSATHIYNTPNNIVGYNGLLYKNKWYTVGDTPYLGGTDTPWEMEGVCPVLLNAVATNNAASLETIDFQVVPNPASDGFYIWANPIMTATVTYRLYDVNGKAVATKISALSNNALYFDAATLPAGVYYLEAASETGRTTKKVILY